MVADWDFIRGRRVLINITSNISLCKSLSSPRTDLDNRHIEEVRLSALRTGRFKPPGNIRGIHFCQRLRRPQGHSAAGRIMSVTLCTPLLFCLGGLP